MIEIRKREREREKDIYIYIYRERERVDHLFSFDIELGVRKNKDAERLI
jgi:hypothetical protein